jgi:hypothetical protein
MNTIHLTTLIFASGLSLSAPAETTRPPAPPPAATSGAEATDPWLALKGYTYDRRELLFAGLKELESRVDAQITELVAKRAGMNANNTSTKEWDFAMEEMGRARTTLISTSNDLTKANRDTWDQQKDKIGFAWVWTQDACAKVKAATTN